MRKNKCLSTVCEYKSHVAEESGLRAMVGEWSRQSPSTRVGWTVPEHDDSLDSPRALWWSGQSMSTRLVTTVPEHKDSHDSPRARGWSRQSPSTKSVAKNHMPLVLLFYVFIYLFALTSLV